MARLSPGDLGVVSVAQAALGDEVEDAALAIRIAGVPVRHTTCLGKSPRTPNKWHRMQ